MKVDAESFNSQKYHKLVLDNVSLKLTDGAIVICSKVKMLNLKRKQKNNFE